MVFLRRNWRTNIRQVVKSPRFCSFLFTSKIWIQPKRADVCDPNLKVGIKSTLLSQTGWNKWELARSLHYGGWGGSVGGKRKVWGVGGIGGGAWVAGAGRGIQVSYLETWGEGNLHSRDSRHNFPSNVNKHFFSFFVFAKHKRWENPSFLKWRLLRSLLK